MTKQTPVSNGTGVFYVKKEIETYTVTEVKPQKPKGMIYMADYAMHSRKQIRHEYFSRSLSPLPANYAVAMMYVPMQTDTTMYDDMKALECGTLFPVLNKHFAGKCCK